jgi:hypothetical protein
MSVLHGTVLALTSEAGPDMESHIGEGSLMKKASLTVMLLCLFILRTHDAQAQVYAPGYYDQSWGETESYSDQYDPYQELEARHYNQLYPRQYDPYYDLEVMHHRLNWPQFQTYQYSPYQIYPLYPPLYPPCCVPGGY